MWSLLAQFQLGDRLRPTSQITYPSGRLVNYVRDTQGRVTSVTTKLNSGASAVTVVSGIVYQPLSGLVQSLSYGNGLNDWNTFTADYELDVLGAYDGGTAIINRAHTRTDNLNLTNIWDNVTSGNNHSFWMNDANRLQNASGPWGDKTFYYDGVGNRTHEITTLSGATVTDVYDYPSGNNRLTTVARGGVSIRGFTYDGAGNITADSRAGTSYAYGYNNRNRLATVTVSGNLRGTYTYNGLEQLAIRVMTNQTPSGTVHSLYDRAGNLLAETAGGGATGSTGTTREYIWLPDVEIAPTVDARTKLDRPIAVVADVNTSPVTYWVHIDHLHRPIKMTNAAKATVWNAVWKPWGEPEAITGSVSLDARFPGQWFQIEAGLHYNWHRHYDASIGRYTQPDPLGFVDGPSVYGYVGAKPLTRVDPKGLHPFWIPPPMLESGNGCQLVPDDEADCKKASKWQLSQAGIDDEHEFKTDWQAIPNSRFDICACKDGFIRIRNAGQCGTSGPTISTTYRWK